MAREDVFKVLLDDLKRGGFLYEVRHLNFIEERSRPLLKALSDYRPRNDREFIRFVKSFWNIPSLMIAWEERCMAQGANERSYAEVRSKLIELIGGIIDSYEHGLYAESLNV